MPRIIRQTIRGAIRLVIVSAIAGAGLLATNAHPASASPSAAWSADYYDFGSSPGSHVFTFTNIYTLPMVDLPVAFQTRSFEVIRDTCESTINPGGTCKVTVQYLGAPGQRIGCSWTSRRRARRRCPPHRCCCSPTARCTWRPSTATAS